jgi:hypothetical protein
MPEPWSAETPLRTPYRPLGSAGKREARLSAYGRDQATLPEINAVATRLLSALIVSMASEDVAASRIFRQREIIVAAE